MENSVTSEVEIERYSIITIPRNEEIEKIFLATLDQLIVATALPRIASDFNSLGSISWVGTSYFITGTAFQPIYGKFSDIFGRKNTFLFSILLFVFGSMLCGLSWNMVEFLRITLLGGLMVLAIVIFFLHLPQTTGSLIEKFKRIDFIGTGLIVASTTSILLPLNLGGSVHSWNSPLIIVPLVIGILGYFIFILVEIKFAVEPVMPSHIFKIRNVNACYLVNITQGMVFYGIAFYLPLFFQVVKGDSATKSGIETIPFVLGVSSASVGSGQLLSRTDKISFRTIAVLGSSLMAIGVGLITTWTEDSNIGAQIGYMIIAGLGTGFIFQPTLLCSQSVTEIKDVATVSALIIFFRTLGGIFGIAIAGAIFNNSLIQDLNKIQIPLPLTVQDIKGSASKINELPEPIKKSNAPINSLNDVINEEAPPAYTPYPNSGETSMLFGPNRIYGETPYQPPQPQVYYCPNTIVYPSIHPISPITSAEIHYPAGYICPICNCTGYERPGMICQQCLKLFVYPPLPPSPSGIPPIPSTSMIHGNGFGGYGGGGVIYLRPGDPTIGGRTCPTCKGREKFLFEKLLCSQCQGIGRIFK
ncbi:2849_t:CDS:10 [Diversispora eburnea]|uniref:2849_t:CDS:1 n=1 Tax=Diversispora eburnea TaxID=1213867 RepID=A0A9N8ZV91_9GLOM|nr:2849_t:CDS:10 [Diversispora eburnea]